MNSLTAGAVALGTLVVSLGLAASAKAAPSAPLVLVGVGQPRALPERLLGASAEPFFEDLIGNPLKEGILASLHPAYLRFPGGTQSNYYDWRKGQIFVTGYSNSSAYTNYWVNLAQSADTKFPNGISFEQYKGFADRVGADTVLVPNLQTSTVFDQVAWFSQLADEKMVPTHIELGNEFWAAMAGDPNVEAIFPDEFTSLAIMEQYLEALRPYLPPGTKAAIQASPGSFQFLPTDKSAYRERLWQWNLDLAPAGWFDAVTTHLYSALDRLTGDPNADYEPVTSATVQRNYAAMMAHYDDGADAALTDLEARLPGKEIWITEWNAEGQTSWQPGQTQQITSPMELQIVTRMELACLRHASVTMNLYFSLNFFTNKQPFDFVPDGHGGFLPLPTTVALGWFFEAANGGATFLRLVEPSAPRIPGGGAIPETYAAVEGALLQTANGRTILIQNASAESRSYDPSGITGGVVPSRIEMLSLPNLVDISFSPAVVTTLSPAPQITIPGYSVTRIILPLPVAAPAFFYTLSPCRAVDTRLAAGPLGGPALAAGTSRSFLLAGVCGIPADAAAVALNVAVTDATAPGTLTVYPGTGPTPETNTLCFSSGNSRANNSTMGVIAGVLSVADSQTSGTVQVIVDVSGYYR
jgi:hypothetical protein